MEDDAMLVKVSNPSDPIQKMEVFSGQGSIILSEDGCYSDECSIDTDSFSDGNYNVVITTLGTVFTEVVQIR